MSTIKSTSDWDWFDEEDLYPDIWVGTAYTLSEEVTESRVSELHKTVFEVTGKYPQRTPKIKMGFY